MSPTTIALIVSLVQEAIKVAPTVKDSLARILNGQGTPAEWDALRAEVMALNYADLVPDSVLPKGA